MAKKRGGLETRERRLSYQRHGLAKAGGDPRKEARDRGAAFHSAGPPALVLGRYARPAGIRQNPKLKPKPIAAFFCFPRAPSTRLVRGQPSLVCPSRPNILFALSCNAFLTTAPAIEP